MERSSTHIMVEGVAGRKLPSSHAGSDMTSFLLYQDVLRQWRWRLRASNGRTIADSGEAYLHKQDCLHAISLVKGSSAAPVDEQ